MNLKEEGPKEIKETKIGSNIKQNVGRIAVGQTDSGMFQLKSNHNNGSLIVSGKDKSSGQSGTGNNSSGVQTTDNKKEDSLVFLDEQATAYRFKGQKQVEKGQYRIPFIFRLP
jgi:hypothetical protein